MYVARAKSAHLHIYPGVVMQFLDFAAVAYGHILLLVKVIN